MQGQYYVFVLLFCFAVLLGWHLYKMRVWKSEEQELFRKLDTLTEEIIGYLPWGIVIIDSKGGIVWHNEAFSKIIGIGKNLKGTIRQYLPEIGLPKTAEVPKVRPCQLAVRNRIFQVESYELKKNLGYLLLTFDDVTELVRLEQFRQDEMPVLGLIQIDNFSETVQEVEDEKRPVLLGEIDRVITEWATRIDGYLRKFTEDKYLLVINQGALKESQKNRFDIMDRIREISLGNRIPVTLSMGIGVGEETVIDLSRLANLGLELALGRGGDQVVLKWPDKVLFYGGKSNAVEKKTKVRARVVAYTLKHYIEQASKVIVMGHESSDLDSAGAALGVARIVQNLAKKVAVVLDNSTGALDKLFKIVKDYPEYDRLFINGREVLHSIDNNFLLVICDTHKPSLLVEPALLKKADKVILIDHHRRAEEFINEAQVIYAEPYASSTSELVTEIIQYLGEDVSLDPFIATVLLAGITVDTKNFVFQTGVRTFEAASFLRRSGAETGMVRLLLQDDFSTVLERAQVIQKSEILFERIAVGVLDRIVPHNTIIAAQTADILLTIENIIASFVLYTVPDGVRISGRSNGELNVQVLLEQLGGGGHLSVAGAQLKGVSINEAREKLRTVLKSYFDENNLTIDN